MQSKALGAKARSRSDPKTVNTDMTICYLPSFNRRRVLLTTPLVVGVVASVGLTQPQPGQPEVPTKRAVQQLRLGGADAQDPFAFAEVPVVVVDSTGAMFVRLSSEGTILVLRPDGRFVRKIGRTGEGPGEFRVATEHGLIGDTLWVRNWTIPKISMFLKDGTHLSTRRTPFDYGVATAAPTGISGLLVGDRAYTYPYEMALRSAPRATLPMLVGTREMTNADTIVGVPNRRGLTIEGVGAWAFNPIPMPPFIAISALGTSVAVAHWATSDAATLDVRVVAPTGAERFRRRLTFAARPLPKSARDSLIAVGVGKSRPQVEAARRRGVPLAASHERMVEEGLALPSHYPPIKRMVLGVDGTVWLERSVAGPRRTWLVLSRTGDRLFQVDVPNAFELQQASVNAVWGVERDQLDVSYLVRLTIVDR